MRQLFMVVATVLLAIVLTGCGAVEQMYDKANYESLTNEVGDVYVLSGGKVVYEYKNAKVLYSSSDTQAMWIVVDGRNVYIQGDTVIELKK